MCCLVSLGLRQYGRGWWNAMSGKPFFCDLDQIGCYSRPVTRPIVFVGCPNHSCELISVCVAPFQPRNECGGIADRKNPAVFVFPNDVGGRAVRSGQDGQTGCLCLGQHNGVTILNRRQDKHVLLAVNGRKRELSLAWYEFNVTLGFRPQFSSFHREIANKTEIHLALEAPRNFEEVKSALLETEGAYRQDSEWLAGQYAGAPAFDVIFGGAKASDFASQREHPDCFGRCASFHESPSSKRRQYNYQICQFVFTFLARHHPRTGTVDRLSTPNLFLFE